MKSIKIRENFSFWGRPLRTKKASRYLGAVFCAFWK